MVQYKWKALKLDGNLWKWWQKYHWMFSLNSIWSWKCIWMKCPRKNMAKLMAIATYLLILAVLAIKTHDVIKSKHFLRYWPIVWGMHRSPVNSAHKGQWRGVLMFSLICVWINSWVNNHEAGYLRCYRVHYDVIVMIYGLSYGQIISKKMKHINVAKIPLQDNIGNTYLIKSVPCWVVTMWSKELGIIWFAISNSITQSLLKIRTLISRELRPPAR